MPFSGRSLAKQLVVALRRLISKGTHQKPSERPPRHPRRRTLWSRAISKCKGDLLRQPLQARCAGSRQWLAVLAKHGTRFERINAADAATPTAQHLCARDHAATAARACGLTPSTWVGRVCAAHVHPLTALPHPCVARVSAHRRQMNPLAANRVP